MEVKDAPSFAPGNYVEDAKLVQILPTLEDATDLAFGDFVDDHHVPTFLRLVEEMRRRESEKPEEWRLVAKEQRKVYRDFVGNKDA
jgi:hypothetical protein